MTNESESPHREVKMLSHHSRTQRLKPKSPAALSGHPLTPWDIKYAFSHTCAHDYRRLPGHLRGVYTASIITSMNQPFPPQILILPWYNISCHFPFPHRLINYHNLLHQMTHDEGYIKLSVDNSCTTER